MDRPRAARARLLSIACGSALLAISFLPLWATYRVPGLGLVAPTTVHQNAWTAYGFGMQLALLLAVAAVVLAVALTIDPQLPMAAREPVLLGLCGAVVLLLLWQAAIGPEGSSQPNGYGISRGVLLYAGIGLACGMTYGGYVVRREAASGVGRSGMMDDGVAGTRAARTTRGE